MDHQRIDLVCAFQTHGGVAPVERILVVEDEAALAALTTKTLCSLGYESAGVAWSGEEALDAVQKRLPALVLMDIELQGPMDGIEAARRIRLDHDIPVIFLTASDDEQTLARAKTAEPLGYIVKPFEPRNLHTAIEIALAQHQASKKQAEKALGQAEKTFRLRFENAVAGMFQAGSDGEFLQANRALALILGYESPDDLTAAVKNVGQVLHVEFGQLQSLAGICPNPATTKKYDLQAYCKDGSTIWVSGAARAIRDAKGEILCWEGSVVDAMDRDREQKAGT
jgi:PAS domain S-box-containing protein